MRYLLTILCAVCIIFPAIFAQPAGQPSMLYLINRHGVREARDTSTHEGGAMLLSTAYDRLYTKGQHLRQQYPSLLSTTYKTDEIRVNSSAWERTITTAYGILAGLYANNDTRSIPVYSAPWEYDYTIYNYDKCPAYDAAWAQFQTTQEWQAQVLKYANLTSYLNALLAPSSKITLANIFSTWDLYWIQRNRPEITVNTPAIDDYTYATLTAAANYVETTRYGARVSGELLGSTLRAAIRYRMDMFVSGNKVFGHKLILTSAHYATQLNFLAALGYTGIVSQSIPDYNSVIAVELYNRTGQAAFASGWSIKMRYYDGSVTSSIPIALGNCAEGQECEIDYATFWSRYIPRNLAAWCTSCQSQLTLCVGAVNQSTLTPVTPSSPSQNNFYSSSSTSDGYFIALLVLCSFLTVFALIYLYRYCTANIQPTIACGAQVEAQHSQIPLSKV